MAGLLVSVRSADEAHAAFEGGAAVVDVKDPSRGPLGRATSDVWRSVREAVPSSTPVSVALGELADWDGEPEFDGLGLAYRKLGLAHAGLDWARRWCRIRESTPGPPWVAVAYADWRVADAPAPGLVLEEAVTVPDCVGILVDTWDKSRRGGLDLSWRPFVERARSAGRLVALAGRLDLEMIHQLAPLRPDLFAVRGAACVGGDRLGVIDRGRVAELVEAALK
ncbi:MAG TPA: (5-formylfuran-3-yl)methyl phosphate synthase [Isosphaeraceae bacterium]